MNGNHNPNVIPGYYNPQQAKTEVGDYQAFLGTEFVDPTQIPMRPGDTQVPMQQEGGRQEAEGRRENKQNNFISNTNLDPSALCPLPSAFPSSMPPSAHIYQQQMAQTYRQVGETIKIPIVIELTINLHINHGGS